MVGTIEKMEVRQWLTIENKDQQIFGILHRPRHVENPPIVVISHGFASSKHGSNRCYVSLAEQLTRVGIAALRFDFRGSGDSEGDLSQLSLEDLRSDVLAVIQALDKMEGIDNTKVALFGASLGGTLSILAASDVPQLKALCLWSPVASGELWYLDFLKHNPALKSQDPHKAQISYKGVTLHPSFRQQFGMMFAYKLLPKLTVPVLHMHGTHDTLISIQHQEAFRMSCREAPQVEFRTYEEGQHSLGRCTRSQEICQEIVDWFQKLLCN